MTVSAQDSNGADVKVFGDGIGDDAVLETFGYEQGLFRLPSRKFEVTSVDVLQSSRELSALSAWSDSVSALCPAGPLSRVFS